MSNFRKLLLFSSFVLSVCVVLFILYQSLQPGDHSAQLSQNMTSRLNQLLILFHIDGVISERMIRKLAHIIEYAAFGFFVQIFLFVIIKQSDFELVFFQA